MSKRKGVSFEEAVETVLEFYPELRAGWEAEARAVQTALDALPAPRDGAVIRAAATFRRAMAYDVRVSADVKMLKAKTAAWLAGIALVCGTVLLTAGRDIAAYGQFIAALGAFFWGLGWKPPSLRESQKKVPNGHKQEGG